MITMQVKGRRFGPMLKKLAVLSLWCWEDSKGFAKDADGKIDIGSLLKQQTSRAESGIE